MQDLNALQGKNLAELREIARTLGITDVMVKKRELIEKIAAGALNDTPAENNAPAAPAPEKNEKPRRGRRPRVVQPENQPADLFGQPQQEIAEPAPAAAEAVASPEQDTPEQPAPKRRGRKPKVQPQPATAGPQPEYTESPDPEAVTKDDFAGEIEGEGVLEVMADGYGFLRSADYNYLNSPD
ncbi:MAG: transcription termination factor Rho, partial [Alistipes sp.]|nr:transcription termination factor Rho [Alistipes sp.]